MLLVIVVCLGAEEESGVLGEGRRIVVSVGRWWIQVVRAVREPGG